MTTRPTPTTLDDVLDLFQMEEVHDGEVLARYVEAHPQFALQLIDLSRLLATPEADDEEPLSALEKSRIDAAWIVHMAAGPELPKGANPLDALIGERGKALAATLGVPRQVVTCLRERKVDPTRTPRPILRTLGGALAIPEAHVIAAMRQPPPTASRRSFKSDGKPGADAQVSFEQVLIDADVSEADRARLLADGD
jgi:hypothetical protein